jgi:hypothetical protein
MRGHASGEHAATAGGDAGGRLPDKIAALRPRFKARRQIQIGRFDVDLESSSTEFG